MISPTRTASLFRGGTVRAATAAAVLLALATGCGSSTGAPAGGSTNTASRPPSRPTSHPVKDTSISAEPGERFTLTVVQNASTREYWYLAGPEPDSSVLVSRGRSYARNSGDETAPGGGRQLTFTFEAKGRGTTRFTLLHCTFTTCRGNTAAKPPATTGPDGAPEHITYTVTVG
ncbi:protease inhibitor I42 family protein [Streptomyces sp. NPDC026659]|uniref:protease inhibitor I42 family protein n=1 Tax=Streptomyces sp. NPDC026659 TaxID=3155123 RepID=UPI00340463A7